MARTPFACLVRRYASPFLAPAVFLVAFGLGLSHFARYTGQHFDERLVIFDNGLYPSMWGAVVLVWIGA